MENLNVLCTGGTGFIGSHTVLALLEAGCKVTIVDNLRNSFLQAFDRMKELAGAKAWNMRFARVDLQDKAALDAVFASEKFDAVVHFAAMKAVGESMRIPLSYYSNNVGGTLNLLEVMDKYGCKTLVYSSTCCVYGNPKSTPIYEDFPRTGCSVYGRTKIVTEDMMMDIAKADEEWRIILLRYFNPVGAHPSGKIGEHPIGIPNNLMPYMQQVAAGVRPQLKVFGGDYASKDGTCIRDYTHVMDLATAHVKAIQKAASTPNYGCKAINLGTGKGYTVLEMIKAFEDASGVKISYTVVDRRPGDQLAIWAATDFAEKEIGWKAEYNVADMCRDRWTWTKNNPNGYERHANGKHMEVE